MAKKNRTPNRNNVEAELAELLQPVAAVEASATLIPVEPAPAQPETTPVETEKPAPAPAPSEPVPTPVEPAPAQPETTPVETEKPAPAPAPSEPVPTPVEPAPAPAATTPTQPETTPVETEKPKKGYQANRSLVNGFTDTITSTDFLIGATVGIGLAGLGYAAYKYFTKE